MTAPEFQPFKRVHAKKKQKLDQAAFLLSEEGKEELPIVHETIDSVFGDEFYPQEDPTPRSPSIPHLDDALRTGVIYIDEVMEKANE